MGAFFTIIFMGFVGTMIDLIFFEMTSDFGIIMAIAAMCPMILNRIGGDEPEDEPTGYGQDEEESELGELSTEELTPDDLEQDESDDDNDTDQT